MTLSYRECELLPIGSILYRPKQKRLNIKISDKRYLSYELQESKGPGKFVGIYYFENQSDQCWSLEIPTWVDSRLIGIITEDFCNKSSFYPNKIQHIVLENLYNLICIKGSILSIKLPFRYYIKEEKFIIDSLPGKTIEIYNNLDNCLKTYEMTKYL